MRSRARAPAANVPIAPEVVDPAVCPACGDDLFTLEHGCQKCGHGQKSFLARNTYVIPFAIFFLLALVGFGALATIGAVAEGGVLLNVVPLLTSAFLVAFGVKAIQRPTSLVISDIHTDAWGQTHMSNSRQATSEQGIMAGAICLVIGAILFLLGVFAGFLV